VNSLRWFSLLLVPMLLVSCRRHDYRTVKIDVPDMKNKACEEVVRRAIAGVPALQAEKTEIDPVGRTVTVSYDSIVLSLKNVEFAIADAGFAADDVPANAEAAKALPAECKIGP
jgi:copper chaperone CopZ